MPVDLPPTKLPKRSATVSDDAALGRALNWLAVGVGIGLCVYAVNYGMTAQAPVNSLSLTVQPRR